ncbi:S1C family serine protease [Bauldia sp.]|uniref:S1C family serine protease n=1 Tax=Bauldia sp. TaxID=2575872 RepID=UPI003BAB8A19
MSTEQDWQVAESAQPDPSDYSYDLDRALSAMVSVRSTVPNDAFTADILGTERAGNGVLIRADGVVLTIGYLVTEAETVWLGLHDGRSIPGHVLGYDQTTGFGLVQALARVDLPTLDIGSSTDLEPGTPIVLAGAGGRAQSLAGRVLGKQEFAGYWEYLLDEAIFTAPAHPQWGGAGLIGPDGTLRGIGSLRLEQSDNEVDKQLNMIVPIDLLSPILDDMLTLGRPNKPPRPWLGLYAVEVDDQVVVAGTADGAPAEASGLENGDVIVAVAGTRVDDLASFFRKMWSLGAAGVDVPLTVYHDGQMVDMTITSGDRNAYLKAPRLH